MFSQSAHAPMPLPSSSYRNSCFTVFLSLQGRSHLNHEKEIFAQDHPEVQSLEEVVRLVKPTAIIGRRREAAHCPARLTLLICRWRLRLSKEA